VVVYLISTGFYLMSNTYIIIGVSAAGLGVVHTLRKLDAAARIVCISYELEDPYNKCFIVDYLSGAKERSAVLTLTDSVAQSKHIERVLGVRVISIDQSKCQVVCSNGAVFPYTAVCIATGCSPVLPEIAGGGGAQGIFTFYHISDVDSIRAYIAQHNVQEAVVVGAGFTGLEAADGLRAHVPTVSVIERSTHALPHHVDTAGAALIEQYMQKSDVRFYANTSVVQIEQSGGAVKAVILSDGRTILAHLVIYAVGARPHTELASASGILLRDGYIAVDDAMQTSAQGIYAAGDCAVLPRRMRPSFTWPAAMYQGTIAAHSMAGQSKIAVEAPPVISSSFFGIKFASCGVLVPVEPELYTIKITSGTDFYHRLVYKDGFLRGFVLVGNTQLLAQLRRDIH
jgi:NAD(P)H-nitrite reductase large subunit